MTGIVLSNCLIFCPLCLYAPYVSCSPVSLLVFYSISMLIAEGTICWWIVHICQYVYAMFFSRDHCCWVITCPARNITSFHFFHLSRFCGIPFLLGVTNSKWFFEEYNLHSHCCENLKSYKVVFCFVRLLNKSGNKNKLSTYSLCPCPSTFLSVVLQLHVLLSYLGLHMSCPSLSIHSYHV
jgi:hypothetical protein